jgi:fibronectin type 3 domain-containing protein
MNAISYKNCLMDQVVTAKSRTLLERGWAAVALIALIALSLVLPGCGGGSAGVSSEVVSGVAAVGTPLSGQVSLKDSGAPAVQKSTVIASDGSYAIDVTGLKAPFVLQAKGTADGTSYTLHSYAEGTGTANINPLTDAIVASAADVNDSSEVFEKADAKHNHHIGSKIGSTVSTILAKLQPLLLQYSAEHSNPITSKYIANHLGLDELFDKVKIVVNNGTLSIINLKTRAVIFTGKLTDIANGIFDSGALPPTAAVPAAPTALSAVGGTAQVSLSWAPVSGASSYNIYWSNTTAVSSSVGTKIASVTSPYLHSGLAAGKTYFYVVTAVNSAGESAASPQASAVTAAGDTTALPAAPTGVLATGGTNQLTVSWSAVTGATSYTVYYATASGVTKQSGSKLANATSPAVLTGLSAGTSYYVIVSASNANGEGAASVQVAAATLPAVPSPTLPAAPAGVSAQGGTNQVTVNWPAVTGAVSYNVYWSASAGVTKATGTKLAGVTSPYVKTGLADGTTYYFVVTAVNSVGESAASTQVSAATAAAQVIDGMALYNANCSGCHGTAKLGKTASAIQSAISGNIGGMGYLSTLTTAQVAAIAAAGTSTTPPTTTLDGAALYASYCAGCHGSSKRGKAVSATQAAIASNRGGMGSLSGLTAAELTAISLY